jgi:trk system potassium uptake protein
MDHAPQRRPQRRGDNHFNREGDSLMKVIIVGCGRVGAHTAASLARQGHEVVVIDKDPQAFRLLPNGFRGRTITGYAFDRDILEEAGIAEADALVCATSGDNTNAVSARIAKEVYRVPDVVSRIYDPQRAEIYRHYGIQTFAPTAWSAGRIIEFLVSGDIEREQSFGNGEVEMIAAFVPAHLVGKLANDLRIPGEIRVGLIVRMGKAMLPVSGSTFEADDQVYALVHQSAVEKFQRMMGWKP